MNFISKYNIFINYPMVSKNIFNVLTLKSQFSLTFFLDQDISMATPVPTKIVLKSTTKMSLNDR